MNVSKSLMLLAGTAGNTESNCALWTSM